jgi:hypothetical protein
VIVPRPGPSVGVRIVGQPDETDFRLKMLTVGFFGATGGDLREGAVNSQTEADRIRNDGAVHDEPYIWRQPVSPADRAGGAFCTRTGYWASARDIVRVNGKPYIRDFAPEDDR